MADTSTLKLDPEVTGTNYDAILTKRASKSAACRQLEHLEIRIPQDNVLTHNDYLVDLDGPAPKIKLSSSSIEGLLQKTSNLKTFRFWADECIWDFTREAFDGGSALEPLGSLDGLLAIRLTESVFNSVDILARILNPNLRELKLDYMRIGTDIRQERWSRSDCKGLVRAISTLSNLVRLSLSDCYLRDEDLDELLSDIGPNLRSLDLSGGWGDGRENTSWITDVGLTIIARHCPNLEDLSLGDQRGATLTGLEFLANGCPNLRSLHVGIVISGRMVPAAVETVVKLNKLLLLTVDRFAPKNLAQSIANRTGGRTLVCATFGGLVDIDADSPKAIRDAWKRTKKMITDCDEKKADDPCVFNQWVGLEEIDATRGGITNENPAATPIACAWHACPNKNNADTFQACSRCKLAAYCSKSCQKKHWEVHKHKCVAPDVARHEVEDFTIQAVQNAIDAANSGDIVLVKEGTYEGGSDGTARLTIDKPLKLWGPKHGMDNVTLNCEVVIKPSGSGQVDSKDVVVLADFAVNGTGNINNNVYKSITLYNIRVQCPTELRGEDTLTINDCSGKCLLLDCEIYGGRDGIFICTNKVHLKRTEIRFASSRDIFAKEPFVIEDCEISNCGSYGIKGRCGWTEKGKDNDIQPGPWGPNGPTGSETGFLGASMW